MECKLAAYKVVELLPVGVIHKFSALCPIIARIVKYLLSKQSVCFVDLKRVYALSFTSDRFDIVERKQNSQAARWLSVGGKNVDACIVCLNPWFMCDSP